MEKDNITLIVAVSGGADSLALLHKLHMEGASVIAAHFNHQLRLTAGADARFVAEFCEQLGISCVIGAGDVAGYAENNRVSIETAGRHLRYAFLADVAGEYSGDVRVVTAHHANDSAESMIMHLLRGCGLGGLCGIAPEMDMTLSDGRVIRLVRPFLGTTRAEIEAYCAEYAIVPCEDESNNDRAFFRNRIRHDVMPVLYEHTDPCVFARTASLLRVDEDFLNEITKKWIEQHRIGEGDFVVLPRGEFVLLHLSLKRRVILWLARELTTETVPLERVDSAIEMIEKNLGNKTIQLPGKVKVSLNKGEIECFMS